MMFASFLNLAVLALATSWLVSAQTYSDCNPVEGDSCPANPAFGDDTVTVDFTKGESDVFTLANGTSLDYDDSMGAVFTINSEADAPTIISTNYLFFGRVDVVVQAAPGVGIVTSFTLQSDDLDEIDWEWLGASTDQCQSNYFGKGDTTTYDRGAYHNVDAVTTTFHTYSIDWTAEKIDWLIDGSIVRTLNYADAQDGARYPQTPMQVRLGTWVGGSSTASEGTIEWAGGLADFDNAPFVAYYQSVTINDYSNGVSGAKEYIYGDDSGDYGSIKIVTEDGSSTSKGPSSKTTSAISATGSLTSETTTTTTTSTSNSTASTSTLATETSQAEVDGSSAGKLSFGSSALAICALALGFLAM